LPLNRSFQMSLLAFMGIAGKICPEVG